MDEDLELSFGDDSVEGAEDAIAAAFDGDDEVDNNVCVCGRERERERESGVNLTHGYFVHR